MSNRSVTRNVPLVEQDRAIWVVVLVGVTLALFGTWQISATDPSNSSAGLGFEVFTDVGLPLVAVGITLYVRRVTGIPGRPVARWTLVGIVALGLLAVWATLPQLRARELLPTLGTLSLGANLGILFGVIAGINRAQAKANANLAERERAQREGLAFLNHLLRHHVLNGMTIINGYTDELRKEGVPDEHVEVIERQSDRIVTLVENVQTLVQSLSEEVDSRPVDVGEVAERAVDEARETSPGATFEVETESAVVLADEFLQKVLGNLLSNAVEHHDGDPHVRVDVEAGSSVFVRVADDGPGVPERIQETFDESDEMLAAVAGDGLGLYLVHTLVTNYGGTVTIDDNEPRGTVVTIALPRY